MLTYTITETDHCRSAASFLRNLLPSAPSGYLRKLLKSGHLAINGVPVESSGVVLRCGDLLTLKESDRTRGFLGRREGLDILYEDDWIIAFNKVPGLAMHRAAEVDERNLVDLGGRLLAKRDDFGGKLRPVNRLDRGTSGVVVLAKTSTAAGMFGRFVKEEGLGKVYLAVVSGMLPEAGTIDLPLDGKEAETRFVRLISGSGATVAAVYPRTGRMHQIRLHFQALGHPVAGDIRYGGKRLSGYEGTLLHSFRTSLVHPATGRQLSICAPLPEGFLDLVKKMAGDRFTHLLALLPEIPDGVALEAVPTDPAQS